MFSSRYRVVTPKIIQPDAGNRKWWVLLLMIVIAIWSWFVFDFGRQRAGLDIHGYDAEVIGLEQKLEKYEKRIEALTLQSAAFERSAQIDKNAAIIAQQDLKLFQQEKAELKRELDFLNGLLSDNTKTAAIRLKRVLITQASENNSYNLRFTLVHLTKVGGTVKGNVEVRVSGSRDGKDVKLSLAELAADKKSALKMGFKNFQKFEVTLLLPDGFKPVSVTFSTEVEGKGIEDLEQTQPWRVAAK